jgi:hypothetical protein
MASGSVSERSFCGEAKIVINHDQRHGYHIQQVGEDGFVIDYMLKTEATLQPAISLLMSIVTGLGFEKQSAVNLERPTLCFLPSIELERLQVGISTVTMISTAETDTTEFQIKSKCGKLSTEGHYWFHRDGTLQRCQYGWREYRLVDLGVSICAAVY